MIVADLLNYLDTLLSVKDFADYCPNGLQIGNLRAPVKKIAVAVTADLTTIQTAADLGANVLVAHHGLFWKGMPYPITDMLYNRIQSLICNDIQLITYHLPLDAHPTIGNNWKTALDMKWEHLKPFGSTLPQIGVQGTFPPLPIEDFIRKLSDHYATPIQAQALGGATQISSAALISGGAYKELSQAIACKVDCFITGNYDEPAWSMALENQIHFLAFGHTATEKVGPKSLSDHISSHLNLPTVFIDTSNPF